MADRSKNGLRGGLPSPALPGSGPGGRRSASELSPASQPFLPAPGLPGPPFGPAPSITSQTIFTLHGANDGRLGPKAPACTGQTSWLRRKLRRRSGPVPSARYGVPGTVRSCYRARLDGSDLQEHPAPAALSACVLSSHREDQRNRDTLASVKNLAAAQRTVVQSPASNTKTARVRAAEKINGGMPKPSAAHSPAASAEAASPGGVSSCGGTRRWRRWNRRAW